MTSASATSADHALLDRLERYYDAVPRTAADVVESGPFTLFVARGGWPYYARPRLGDADAITPGDVRILRELQVARGVPETIEWVPATTPGLGAAAVGAGLTVSEYPLMVLADRTPAPTPTGFDVRLLEADDPALLAVLTAVHRGFGSDGGPDEVEVAQVRSRIGAGHQVVAGAFAEDGTPVGGGAHQPVGDVTELVGIAVLGEFRRRGLGAALTDTLVEDAVAAGVDVVFLSAGDDAVARTYSSVGFRSISTAAAASPPESPDPTRTETTG
jgi:ribosomal protein S18 acetylase RimI-like enzyme